MSEWNKNPYDQDARFGERGRDDRELSRDGGGWRSREPRGFGPRGDEDYGYPQGRGRSQGGHRQDDAQRRQGGYRVGQDPSWRAQSGRGYRDEGEFAAQRARSGYGRDDAGQGGYGGYGAQRDYGGQGGYGYGYAGHDYGEGVHDYGPGGRQDAGQGERSGSFGQGAQGRDWRAGGHRGRGPKNYARSDERIREDVSDRLTDDAWLDASEIEVQAQGGEVTLTGTVQSREDKRRAEDMVEQVSGVRHIQNNLRVQTAGQSDQTHNPGASGTAASSGQRSGSTETR